MHAFSRTPGGLSAYGGPGGDWNGRGAARFAGCLAGHGCVLAVSLVVFAFVEAAVGGRAPHAWPAWEVAAHSDKEKESGTFNVPERTSSSSEGEVCSRLVGAC